LSRFLVDKRLGESPWICSGSSGGRAAALVAGVAILPQKGYAVRGRNVMRSSTIPQRKSRLLAAAIAVALLLALGLTTTAPDAAYADDDQLPAPTSVKAKATKKCTIQLSWKGVSGATGYTIYGSTKKTKGYEVLGYVSGTKALVKAPAGKKYYCKVAAFGYDGEDGAVSKPVGAKVSATFKNSYVKFTVPKYWRGKVYIDEDTGNRYYKEVNIREAKTGEELATLRWSRRYEQNDGDFMTFNVKRWKRGKGMVELWMQSWPQTLYASKYLYHAGNPTASDGSKLSKSEIDRLIKLQTGGKYSYKKVKKVSVSKSGKYSYEKYVKKNLKVKIVK
ncbi:hypothetical protein, partial [uncultured Adlercreutzia sp.]